MNALALSITSYITGEQLIRPISMSYGHALQLLQNNLRLSGGTYRAEQAAAVMCIALLEVRIELVLQDFLNRPYIDLLRFDE